MTLLAMVLVTLRVRWRSQAWPPIRGCDWSLRGIAGGIISRAEKDGQQIDDTPQRRDRSHARDEAAPSQCGGSSCARQQFGPVRAPQGVELQRHRRAESHRVEAVVVERVVGQWMD